MNHIPQTVGDQDVYALTGVARDLVINRQQRTEDILNNIDNDLESENFDSSLRPTMPEYNLDNFEIQNQAIIHKVQKTLQESFPELQKYIRDLTKEDALTESDPQ